MMQRLRFNGVGNLNVESAEVPELGPRDALVRIRRCGVCGTDLSMWRGTFSVPHIPLTPGHELSGEVAALGASAEGLPIGTRVVVDINMTCNQCFWCRNGDHLLCPHLVQIGIHTDGGMAEYVKAPVDQLIRLPDSVSYDAGASVEPLACAVHAQERGGISLGQSVVVVGCGLMGFMHAKLAELRGADPVIVVGDMSERQELARVMGIENYMLFQDAQTPNRIRDLTRGRGADVVIEAAGAVPAYKLAFGVVRKGGKILGFGIPPAGSVIPLDPFNLFNQQLSIIGSFVTNRGAWQASVELLESGRLDISPIQSALVSLDMAPAVPNMLREHPAWVKVLVDPAAPAGTAKELR